MHHICNLSPAHEIQHIPCPVLQRGDSSLDICSAPACSNLRQTHPRGAHVDVIQSPSLLVQDPRKLPNLGSGSGLRVSGFEFQVQGFEVSD